MTHLRINNLTVKFDFWWPVVTTILTWAEKILKHFQKYSLRAIQRFFPAFLSLSVFFSYVWSFMPPPPYRAKVAEAATRARVSRAQAPMIDGVNRNSQIFMKLCISTTWVCRIFDGCNQWRRHELLTGGGRTLVRQIHLPPNSEFSSDFGHFILKILKNIKFLVSSLKKNL